MERDRPEALSEPADFRRGLGVVARMVLISGEADRSLESSSCMSWIVFLEDGMGGRSLLSFLKENCRPIGEGEGDGRGDEEGKARFLDLSNRAKGEEGGRGGGIGNWSIWSSSSRAGRSRMSMDDMESFAPWIR